MGICLMKCPGPWLLHILLLYILINKIRAISPDGEALLSFRTAIASSDGILLNWRAEDLDPCHWKGVTCDAKTKRVIYLNLPRHGLSGSISPDLGKLEHLQILILHTNNFYGTIPSELGNCSKLRVIHLQSNYLSGLIPSEVGNLTGLEDLDISSNSLSGYIPPSLGKLDKLITFNVSTNFLVGPIPADGVLIKFIDISFVGNRDLCGKQINVTCKDDGGGPGTDSQSPNSGQNQDGKKKYSGRLLISASATIGALLLVALMCFWGCFLYKKFGKNDSKSLAMDINGGASIVMFHGDLPYSTKDIIKKLETLNEEHIIGCGGFGTVYKLYLGLASESVDHLFLGCKESWLIWCKVLSWWGVSCCRPLSFGLWFQQWQGLCLEVGHGDCWKLAFFASVWSIWLGRNVVVFEGSPFSCDKIHDLIQVRVCWWFQARWGPLPFNPAFVPSNILVACQRPAVPARSLPVPLWVPPLLGFLKFNTDGASRGNPGLAGAGGVLRNSDGLILAMFSSNIGSVTAISAEFLAIKEALVMYTSASNSYSAGLIIESDSVTAVSWLTRGDSSWNQARLCSSILDLAASISNVSFVHVSRIANSLADKLASDGVGRSPNFSCWVN